MVRARNVAWVMALILGIGAGCSGNKKKSALQKKREAEAAALARLNAKNYKRPPRPVMTPESFAQMVSQPIADAALALIDPEGRVYRTPERQWEHDVRFDASNPAWNKTTHTLYGVSRRGRDVISMSLDSGAMRTLTTGILRPVPKKLDPKKQEAKKEHLQNMEAYFELTPGGLVVAQSVPARGGEMDVKIFGIDPQSGRVRWRKVVQNPWDDGFTLWSQGNFVLLGDSTKGPVHLFDSVKGPTGSVEFPKDETYVFGGTDGKIAVFYHIRKTNELFIAGHGPDGAARWRRPLADCYPNMAYLQAFVDGVLPCKAKTSPKEHIDRVMKVSFDDGRTLWQADVHKRPQDVAKDAQRKDMVTMKAGEGGVVFFRNRFEFVQVMPTGQVGWRYPLEDKEIYILIGSKTYRSENVMAGDEPYELLVSLDPASGKPAWSYKEEKGLPARGLVREGAFMMYGDTEVRIFSVADGKLMQKQRLLPRVEAVAVVGGIAYFDAMGARRAYRLSDGGLVLFDKSEEETVVNNWLEMPWAKELYLYHDDARRLGRIEPIAGDLRVKVEASAVRAARILTVPTIEVDNVRFIDEDKLEFQSVDDKRAWQVPVAGGAPVSVGQKRDGAKGSRGNVAYLGDPVKVEERASIKVDRGGKTTVVTAFPMGEFAWSHGGHELVYAERRPASWKSPHADLADMVIRVFDARTGQSRDALHMKGVEKRASLASVSFGPKDRSITFVLEDLFGSHFIGSVPLGKKLTGEMRISNFDGTVEVKIPKLLPVTKRFGLDQGVSFGEVAWSPDGGALAVSRNQRMVLLTPAGREILPKAESAVSAMKWAPSGKTLVFAKDGNLWRWKGGGAIERLSYFLPKREPRNDEEQKFGNLLRMASLEFSPSGKKLALGLRWPYEGNMRAAVIPLQ